MKKKLLKLAKIISSYYFSSKITYENYINSEISLLHKLHKNRFILKNKLFKLIKIIKKIKRLLSNIEQITI